MYLDHFGLKRLPFEGVSNGSVYVDLPEHREAMNTVLFGLRSGEGFVKVVGEVGTGKTALCRDLLTRLDSDFHTVYLPNPAIGAHDLLFSIADELGITLAGHIGVHALQKNTREILMDIAKQGGRVAVLVDEAQTMPSKTLEELRLLSNLESRGGKLIQAVLFGQPELDERLAQYSMRQLQQRIAFSARLEPLSREACQQYIRGRLTQSGASAHPIFTPAACQRIHRASSGIPRLINILCHKSLLAAFSTGDGQVARTHVATAVADTEGIRRWRTRPLFNDRGGRETTAVGSTRLWRPFPT